MSSSRFKYTEIWRDMIRLLHEQVAIKTRRYLLKTYTGVFTGTNAVDVLQENVSQRQDLFADNTTREHLVRLCQRFLESRVFFPARNDVGNSKVKFEDSNTVFYRFNEQNDYIGAPSSPRVPFGEISNCGGLGGANGQRANSEPDLTRVDQAQQRPQCHTFSPNHGITKHFSFMRKQRSRALGKSCGIVENMNVADDSEEVFDIDRRIERECVRVRLLQLLDLNFVEGFVCSPSATNPGQESRFCEPLQNLAHFHHDFHSSTDPWCKRAIDVMKHIPNAPQILDKMRTYSVNRKKHLLFEEISNYYGRLGAPLISAQWDEVIQAITNLITVDGKEPKLVKKSVKKGLKRTLSRSQNSASKMLTKNLSKNEKVTQALKKLTQKSSGKLKELVRIQPKHGNRKESNEALQLFLRLLDENERLELQHLLSFLYIVQISENVPLSDRHSNINLVQTKFATAVFPVCANYMLKFCIDRLDEAFKLPEAIDRQIKKKSQLIRDGQIDSPHAIPDALFAKQINSSEFQRQRSEGTNQEVLKLIHSIRTDDSLPVERKNQLISSLQSQHPNAGTSLV